MKLVSESIDDKKPDLISIFHSQSYLFDLLKVHELFFQSLEILLTIFLIFFLFPFFLIISIAIKISMGGNIFYSQIRVGKNGELFSIYKFRTMKENAEANTGAILASENDPRITELGKILRSSHLDEFPQLFNVLKGEMSFLGPRPERPEFVEDFIREIENYDRRFEVKPGITGVAQICLPYNATARQKIDLDIFYINNRESVLLHLIVSYYTFLKMLNGLVGLNNQQMNKKFFTRSSMN
jgi:lipopolysaccharide/colanic/teichoic acid biosynthesis glycosyltransferase